MGGEGGALQGSRLVWDIILCGKAFHTFCWGYVRNLIETQSIDPHVKVSWTPEDFQCYLYPFRFSLLHGLI
jgi:hypothetical protein